MSRFAFIFILLVIGSAQSAEPDFLLNTETKINALIEDKIQLSIEKEQLEEQIREMQLKIKTKKNLVLKRLKASYSLKKFKWGELLLNNNVNDLDRNVKILNNLNKYDYELFKDYNSALKMLVLSRKNLQETEELMQKNVENLKTKQEEFKKLEDIKITALQKENKKSLLIFKGKLTRPLDGVLKQEFGSLKDQDNRFYLINRGELYTANANSFVKSVGPGTVIFRDDLVRWRETLIIQHDDNYYSVYAGIKNSKKSTGEHVEQGELIANVAADEFYFELRHYDSPINPRSWYKELK